VKLLERHADWPAELCNAATAYETVMAAVLVLPQKREDWTRQVFNDSMKRVTVARDRFVALRTEHVRNSR
jgi:hypothetical protein